MFYRHHEAGGAEAALGASPVAVGFLDCGQGAVLAHAFDGGDLLAFATGGEHGAGEHRSAVNKNGAGAAGESSHPRLEPVRSSSMRSASSRSRFGSMAISYERALTRSWRSCFFMKTGRDRKSTRLNSSH